MTLTFDLPLVTVRLSPVHRGGPAVAQDFDPSGIYIRGGGEVRGHWLLKLHSNAKQ